MYSYLQNVVILSIIYCLKMYFSEHCINITKMVLTKKTLITPLKPYIVSPGLKAQVLYFKYGKPEKCLISSLSHFQIPFIQSTHQLSARCSHEAEERKEGREERARGTHAFKPTLSFSCVTWELYSHSTVLSFPNIFGKFVFGKIVSWQQMHRLDHH